MKKTKRLLSLVIMLTMIIFNGSFLFVFAEGEEAPAPAAAAAEKTETPATNASDANPAVPSESTVPADNAVPEETKTQEEPAPVVESTPEEPAAPAAGESNVKEEAAKEDAGSNDPGTLVLTKTISGDVTEAEAESTTSFQVKDSDGKYLKRNGDLSSSAVSLSLADFNDTGDGKYSLSIKTDELGKYTVTESDSAIDGKDVSVSHSVNGGGMQAGSSATALVKENSTTKVAFVAEYEAVRSDAKAAEDEPTIIDDYTAVSIEVPFEKKWDDDGTGRPDSLKVILYVIIESTKKAIDEATLSAANDWKCTFEVDDTEESPVFYKDTDGLYHAYELTVEEETIEGYSESDRLDPSVKMDVSVDEGDWIRITPNSTTTYDIYTEGEQNSFIASKKGNQLYIWTKVKLSRVEQQMILDVVQSHPNFPQGETVNSTTFFYGTGHCDEGGFSIIPGEPGSIEFDNHPAWSYWARGSYSRSTPEENAGWIKNAPDTGSVKISKSWEGVPEGADLSGLSITVTGPGEESKTITYADFTEDSYVIEDVRVGETVSVKETNADTLINNYTLSGSSVTTGSATVESKDQVAVINLSNVYEPEKVSVSVKKTWDDADDQDGKRPESITVNLLADGRKTDSKTVTADDNWECTFTDLPKENEDGTEIKYTVAEEAVDGYDTEITGSAADGFTITNKHTPETVNVAVKKVWDDNNNADGKRPASLNVTLSNGNSYSLTEAEGWTLSIDGLPKYKDGKEIEYSWTEEAVDGYKLSQIVEDKSEDTITTTLTNTVQTEVVPDEPTDDNDQTPDKTTGQTSDKPKTGDNGYAAEMLVFLVSLTALAVALYTRRWREDE